MAPKRLNPYAYPGSQHSQNPMTFSRPQQPIPGSSEERRWCHICKKYFADPSIAKRHMKSVHGPNSYQCLCGLDFNRKYSWDRHLKRGRRGCGPQVQSTINVDEASEPSPEATPLDAVAGPSSPVPVVASPHANYSPEPQDREHLPTLLGSSHFAETIPIAGPFNPAPLVESFDIQRSPSRLPDDDYQTNQEYSKLDSSGIPLSQSPDGLTLFEPFQSEYERKKIEFDPPEVYLTVCLDPGFSFPPMMTPDGQLFWYGRINGRVFRTKHYRRQLLKYLDVFFD